MKNKLSVFLSYYLVVSVCILLFSACTNNSSNTIKIGVLNGPSAVSFIQLIDQPTEIDGKKIEIIIKDEPQQIQALMMQGKLDFAILPTVMAANLYNKGLKYCIVACPVWGTLYIMSNGTDRDISDLKGEAISVFGQCATSDILLRRILQQKKIANVRIDYTHTTNNEIAQALLSKKIKLAVVSEPMVSKLLAQDSSIHIVSKLECEEYLNYMDRNIFVQTSFLVRKNFANKNPEIVDQVCEAYSNSCNFTNEQPEKAAKLLVDHNFLPNTEIAKSSIPLCNINYISAFALQLEINRYLNVFYKFNPKSIGGKIPDNDFIYQTY
jgi:NitT/TauT family transport system substrate-binding protein